jgi:hypothetical protein
MVAESYPDDPSISDSAELWRRIHPDLWTRDDNTGQWRPSSSAFRDSSDGTPMSVVLAAPGRAPSTAVAEYQGYGLVVLTGGRVRQLGQRVCRAPTVEEPDHVFVAGPKPKLISRALAKSATIVIGPASP